MKAFTNANPRDLAHALTLVKQAHQDGKVVALAGGGSDLLGMMKERLVTPDVLVNLKSAKGLDQITPERGGGIAIGGLMTLDAVSRHASIRSRYPVLAEAAESVATPQIRNVATLAGNVCQRPWCWYYRNGFACLKNGGNTCFSISGDNTYHAIFGGGPSYIVHPSDTAPALVALGATFRIAGPSGERTVAAADFFTLPKDGAARENVLREDEVLAAIVLPAPRKGAHSAYHKVMDREAWTHAIVSAAIVMEMKDDVCVSARIALGGVAPIPWRLTEVETMIAGQAISPALAAKAGEAAVAGARPLAKNGYKVPMVKAMVSRAIAERGRQHAG
jgi:xanthine dehydrogenase YagS FAD-binding subunit